VEIWDKDWHFTGACEPDPNGLDRGWFVGDAAQAKKDSPEHAIYASSFRKTDTHFPLVWAMRNKTVPAENVTDRYTKKKEADGVRVMIRVLNASKKRVAVPVTIRDTNEKWEGQSKDESADTNDYLTFHLPPNGEYKLTVGTEEQKFETKAIGEQKIIQVIIANSPESTASANAVKALQTALETQPIAWNELANQEFAKVPLTKADTATARELLWKAHVARIQNERKKEFDERILKEDKLEMPFAFKTFGEKPKGGRSLWISMHGGGNAPAQVNDKQWENQKKLYTIEEGIYLAPRAPTNTWNLWHEAHIDRLFNRLIQDLVVFEDVNPDRVYLLGYSAGGDGVYQIAPRMADRWAAAAMMAGHPNGVPLLSLRNLPFALQVGGSDSAYNRNKVGTEYGEQLKKLREDDPKGYEHFVKIHEGKPHWMGGEDKVALPWMAKFTRNPTPERVVWKQSGTPHDRFYWLAVPPKDAKNDSLAIAQRDGQTITIEKTEKIGRLLIRLDDRMADLEKPVKVLHNGKQLYTGMPTRTIAVMASTLVSYGDPKMIFDAEVSVDLK
jgi:predicted peptidase